MPVSYFADEIYSTFSSPLQSSASHRRNKKHLTVLFIICAADGTRTRNLPSDRRVL